MNSQDVCLGFPKSSRRKATISFIVPSSDPAKYNHVMGFLMNKNYGISITHSRPAKDPLWSRRYFVDIIGDEGEDQTKTLQELKSLYGVRVFGSYYEYKL